MGTVLPGLFSLIICFFVIGSFVTGEMTSILARLEHNVLEGDSATTDGFFSGGAPHKTEEMASFFLEVYTKYKFCCQQYENTNLGE